MLLCCNLWHDVLGEVLSCPAVLLCYDLWPEARGRGIAALCSSVLSFYAIICGMRSKALEEMLCYSAVL